jgi:hypothetical protein
MLAIPGTIKTQHMKKVLVIDKLFEEEIVTNLSEFYKGKAIVTHNYSEGEKFDIFFFSAKEILFDIDIPSFITAYGAEGCKVAAVSSMSDFLHVLKNDVNFKIDRDTLLDMGETVKEDLINFLNDDSKFDIVKFSKREKLLMGQEEWDEVNKFINQPLLPSYVWVLLGTALVILIYICFF